MNSNEKHDLVDSVSLGVLFSTFLWLSFKESRWFIETFGTKYSRVDQVNFVEDNL